MKTVHLKVLASLAIVAAVPLAFGQTPGKRIIEVREALVTMIEDVHVPATELGMLTAIHVKEGQQVDEETLLADIDSRESIAKQLIALGERDAAQAQADSTAEIEVAEKAINVAQAELDSMNDIRKTNPGAVSETEIRKFRFQLERAQAQLKLALTEQNIARLTVKTKTAQLQAIGIELDRRQVKAPFKGEVVEVFKKRGEWTQAGEPVLHLVRMDKVRIKGFVLLSTGASPDEVEGKPVEITVHSAGDQQHKLKGTVNFASRVIEGVSNYRQFRVSVDVDNPKIIDPVTKKEGWTIQPGTMANLTIDLAAAPAGRPVVTPRVQNEIKTTPVGGRVEVRKPETKER
jgi:multidrug efflux pump subunit AcrA (membrane-fusion protein)